LVVSAFGGIVELSELLWDSGTSKPAGVPVEWRRYTKTAVGRSCMWTHILVAWSLGFSTGRRLGRRAMKVPPPRRRTVVARSGTARVPIPRRQSLHTGRSLPMHSYRAAALEAVREARYYTISSTRIFCHFCRAMLCKRGLTVLRCLCVSVRHVRGSCQDE